jgi:hypothetical protein
MWRTIVALSMLLTLALGTAADGKCRVCIESVRMDKTDSASTLLVDVRAMNGATLPDKADAVVMQVNGNRSKCLNVPVLRSSTNGDLASYRGTLPNFYGNTQIDSYSGRIDINGDIFEFTVPTDGKPGTTQLVTAAAASELAGVAQAAATVAPTTAPTAAPVAAPAPVTSSSDGWQPLRQPMTWLAGIAIIATLAGALIDRRRALARATA